VQLRQWIGLGVSVFLIALLFVAPVKQDYLDGHSGKLLWEKVEKDLKAQLPPKTQVEFLSQSDTPLTDVILAKGQVAFGHHPGANHQLVVNVKKNNFRHSLRLLWQSKDGERWTPRHVFMAHAPNISWWTLMPAVGVVICALLFGQIILALIGGIILGGTILANGNPILGTWEGLVTHTVKPILDEFHLLLLLFATLIMGLTTLINKMGGMQGVVNKLMKWGTSAKSSQLATMFSGIFLFFDDYASCLVVGPTMRALTDKMKVSRAKLAFIVDSTAAPLAATALISTWIAYEIGLVQELIGALGIKSNAYDLFLSSIPYRFYSILLLGFVFSVAYFGRDFGPMLKAERAARRGDGSRGGAPAKLPKAYAMKEGVTPRWYNAVLPIGLLITFSIAGFIYSGGGLGLFTGEIPWSIRSFAAIFSAASAGRVMVVATFSSMFVAFLLGVTQKLLTAREAVQSILQGIQLVGKALLIWILAWGIGHICQDLQTGHYLIALLGDLISPFMVPIIIFLISAGTSFVTGTSWGSMAILIPMSLPLAFELGGTPLLIISLGAVLDGSIFGDHCSPISDTTIMSSLGSQCDHITHVRTQIPYAVTTMVIAGLIGYLLAPQGVSPFISIPVGLLLIIGLLHLVGKRVDDGIQDVTPDFVPDLKEAEVTA